MADEDEDLKLNTLNRFAKKGTRLALEEYSHCEVPAGCGGVVLRWTDPDEGVPAILMVAAVGAITGLLDGKHLETGRTVIGYGDHVLALTIERTGLLPSIAPQAGGVLKAIANVLRPTPTVIGSAELLVVAVAADEGGVRFDKVALPGAASLGDGTWRVLAADAAPERWTDAAFDDSGWSPLAAAPLDAVQRLSDDDPARWRFRDVDRAGGRALVLPSAATRVFVRKTFTVVRPAGTP